MSRPGLDWIMELVSKLAGDKALRSRFDRSPAEVINEVQKVELNQSAVDSIVAQVQAHLSKLGATELSDAELQQAVGGNDSIGAGADTSKPNKKETPDS